MARKFAPLAPTLAHVRCAVSVHKATLEEALLIMDRPDDDEGTVRMRVEIATCAWVLGLIDGRTE